MVITNNAAFQSFNYDTYFSTIGCMAIAVFSFKFSYVSSNEAFATCCERNRKKKPLIDFNKVMKFILTQLRMRMIEDE